MTTDLVDTTPATIGQGWSITVPQHGPDVMRGRDGTLFGIKVMIALDANAQHELRQAIAEALSSGQQGTPHPAILAARDAAEHEALRQAEAKLRQQQERLADLECQLARAKQQQQDAILVGDDQTAATHQTDARQLRWERDEINENLPAHQQRVEQARSAAERVLKEARQEASWEQARQVGARTQAALAKLQEDLAADLMEVLVCNALRRSPG